MPTDHPRTPIAASSTIGRLEVLFIAGIIAVCALAGTGLAWTRPASGPSSIGYHEVGQVTYSAPTASTSVYGGAAVATGQPVYTNAVPDLTVDYAYRFSSSVSATLRGTEQLVATVDNGQGVGRSFELQAAPTAFGGEGFRASGTLHLADLQTATAAFGQTAGGGSSYVVSIAPKVILDGHLGGEFLRAGFDQPVQFNYRPATTTTVGVLSPLRPSGGAAAAPGAASSSASTTAATPKPLTATDGGAVSRPGGSPSTLLFGISVHDARIDAPIVLAGALLVIVVVGRRLFADLTARDERRRISARFGASMVEVEALPSAPSSTVELSSFDGVLKIARRLGCPILHHPGKTSVFAVVDGMTVYRYVVGGDGAVAAPFVTPKPKAVADHETNGRLVSQRN